jgi:hypothetical protein
MLRPRTAGSSRETVSVRKGEKSDSLQMVDSDEKATTSAAATSVANEMEKTKKIEKKNLLLPDLMDKTNMKISVLPLLVDFAKDFIPLKKTVHNRILFGEHWKNYEDQLDPSLHNVAYIETLARNANDKLINHQHREKQLDTYLSTLLRRAETNDLEKLESANVRSFTITRSGPDEFLKWADSRAARSKATESVRPRSSSGITLFTKNYQQIEMGRSQHPLKRGRLQGKLF